MGSGGATFEEVFARLYPTSLAVARRILGSRAEAEDAAAEAWSRALGAWWRVGRTDHAEAWVLRVTANVAIDQARKRSRGNVAPAEQDPLDAEAATLLRMTLVAALEQLPKRQREVLVLRHLAGLSQAEVAGALRISTESVKTHAARALATLRASGTFAEEMP